ncbi:pyridoxamine 5'-phosphate oxidase family protein [Flavobacterium silvaticum]|uniref:Pyridoxamine 5'-phosphate oxidase family protein n=1 Tax=Flavobacterium silvaticum TaxID=1852020 RepID=A0A972JFW9_9FLAO|nr:pyridoxamine 5'-phosphate oxidase family protein [Flavobacterium silvaticum]NMH27596.1 pyridoxamine 5'-phosphate oxidase family protein [Flavobacterium silvaticum]
MSTKNLSSDKASDKIKSLAEDIKTCFFCTNLDHQPISTRPMGVQQVDDSGNLWFISSRTSNKNFEIGQDSRVQLFFSKASDNEYLSVYGDAEIYREKAIIEALWTPIAKAWFEEGKNDPDVTVIKVTPLDAYYWDTQNGKIVTLLKIAASAITGIRSDVGREGTLRV